MSALQIVIGFFAGIFVTALFMELRNRVKSLDERVKRLEDATPKRLPYKSADEIECATAALLKVIFETDFRKDMLENALAHLQKARNPEK